MRSPFYFIVEPIGNTRYNTTKKIGGVDFIISNSEEDAAAANRQGLVIDVPIGYKGPVSVGDTLLVHHNTFKFYNDMKGRRKSGRSFFKDDTFFVEPGQFFMYKSNGEWHAYDRYCFVKPVPMVDILLDTELTEQPLTGRMIYPNEKILSFGINKGDIVGFTPESEYEFNVDGEKLYRVFDHQITMKM